MNNPKRFTGCYPDCFYYTDSCFRSDCKKDQPRPALNYLQPQIRPVAKPLYPTMGSLQEVVDFGESKLPITSKNELFSLFMVYHNTLLKLTEAVQ